MLSGTVHKLPEICGTLGQLDRVQCKVGKASDESQPRYDHSRPGDRSRIGSDMPLVRCVAWPFSRGGCDATPGGWQVAGGSRVPVTVVMEGEYRSIESRVDGNEFVLPLAALTPIGVLDYPPRPRATTAAGTELAYGFVLQDADHVATFMLLRKSDVAVVAILTGWPSPTDLRHGQNVHEITTPTS
jgi:hypothetical protein